MRREITFAVDPNTNKGRITSSDHRDIEYIRGFFYDNVKIYTKRGPKIVKVFQVTPSGQFNPGMHTIIKDRLKDQYTFKYTESFKSLVKPNSRLNASEISEISKYTYHDYQKESIECSIKAGRGVIVIGTSGGKSLIQAGLCKTIISQQEDSRILIIVPGISLINQLYDIDFITKYGLEQDVTVYTSDRLKEYDPEKRIVITNSECLVAKIKANDPIVKELLNSEYVLIDECHKINKDTKISSILNLCKTNNKFGFTGSMPKLGVDYYNIIGVIGGEIYNKSAKKLREDSFVSQLEIKSYILEHSIKPPKMVFAQPIEYYHYEKKWIINNEKRNKFICAMCNNFTNATLILVDSIEHGKNILNILKAKGKNAVFIQGITKIEERAKIQEDMEKTDLIVVAMDKIFSTGISVNNIHNIVFAWIGVSSIKIIQSIGRGLRKSPKKTHVTIHDISDNLPVSSKHLNERTELYLNETSNIKTKIFKI